MDQIKIGKFIASERKRKQYTQRQLADILTISDKTISKWETGNGFPEISLLLPLCEELDISVNELLSGERLTEKDYKEKAEQNMVDFIREKEDNKTKMRLTFLVGGMALAFFLTVLFVVAAYTDVISLPVKLLLGAISGLAFGTGIVVVISGMQKIGYYKCLQCNSYLVPGFWETSVSANLIKKRRLKCPHCGKKTWCEKVMSKET